MIVCKVFFRQGWNQIEPVYVFALLLVLASASYLLVEKPCRSWIARVVANADRKQNRSYTDAGRKGMAIALADTMAES